MLWLLNQLAPRIQQATQPFVNTHPVFQWVQFTSLIFCLDDCVLEQIKRIYFSRESGMNNNLPGRITALFNLAAGTLFHSSFYDDPLENEKFHMQENVEFLPAGSLLLFDLGYFSFPIFDWLTEHFTFFVSRMKAKPASK